MTKETVCYQDLYKLMDERTTQIMNKFDQMEGRVSTLERWKDGLMVKLSLLATIAGIIGSFFIDSIKKKLNL